MIKRLFSFPTILLLFWIYLAINSHAGAKIEGKLFPVTSEFTITKIEKNPDDYLFTQFSGYFKKLRNCEFYDAKLIIKDGDLEVESRINFLETAKVRKPGNHEYGPWQSRVGIDDLSDADIIVQHNCDKPKFLGIERRVITRTPVIIDIDKP